MKILHVVSSYWPAFEFGGPINSVYLLNKFLVKNRVGLAVYTTNAGLRKNKEIPLKKEVDLDGVKIFYFPYYGYVHWTFSPVLFWALAKNIKNFDMIHITGVWNFPVLAAAFWARVYKKPYIISPRGSLMAEPLSKKSRFKKKTFLFLFVERFLKNASAIHFTVETEKEEYIKAGLSLKETIIIPNGLDIEEFNTITRDSATHFKEKFGIAPDKKIILFLGRINWKKGFDTLIPAFAEVIKKEPKAVLVLAGPDDENYKREVLKFIDEANLRTSDVQKLKASIQTSINQRANIIFTGMLVGEDKIAAFQESDVFVLPSYSENFGMAVAEAMVFGLPVIVTKGVGISNEVEKVGAGIVIEKNEKELSEAILKILNNPALTRKMGESGKRLVEIEFSPGKIADKWIEKYKNIIKNV